MKRLVSKNDEKYYTFMLKVINSIGGRNLDYNWLITDIEAYPTIKEANEIIKNEYIIISNDDLLDLLEKDDFQWTWGIFSAIPKNIDTKEILQYNLPYKESISLTDVNPTIQHPLAEIEIDCMDSSYFQITVKDDKYLKEFKKAFPNSTNNYINSVDHFKTSEEKTMKPFFEFSYYKFESNFTIKKNLLRFLKKKINSHNNSIFLYEQYFNNFINEFPYFNEITLGDGSKGDFDYFGVNNFYDKQQTELILENLKRDLNDDNKLIIRFLEKACKEYNGFYIHGI